MAKWKNVIIAMMATINVAYAEDCSQSELLFDKAAVAAESVKYNEAEGLLEQAVSHCNQFNSWYLLGMVYKSQEKYTDAAASFKDAKNYSMDANQAMLAMARYAETLSLQGQLTEPLSILRKAKVMHPNPPAWITRLMLELDKKRVVTPLTVAQVKRGLQGRSARLLDSDNKPSIDITINFEFDSTDISSDTSSNLEVLADALADQEFNDEKAVIVGHADVRGQDIYNLVLSEQRAQAIVTAIVERKPELKGRISARGLGATQPLYAGNDASIHKLNRRIEVYLE